MRLNELRLIWSIYRGARRIMVEKSLVPSLAQSFGKTRAIEEAAYLIKIEDQIRIYVSEVNDRAAYKYSFR